MGTRQPVSIGLTPLLSALLMALALWSHRGTASAQPPSLPLNAAAAITATAEGEVTSGTSFCADVIVVRAGGRIDKACCAAHPSGGSGSRYSEANVRLPAPQAGRRSRSSGRDSVMTAIGTPRLHSMR